MRHRPVRLWWKPWARRCACGCRWYPCPDGRPPAQAPTGDQVAQALGTTRQPSWTGPTVQVTTVQVPNAGPRSLLTPGQRWRAEQGNQRRPR